MISVIHRPLAEVWPPSIEPCDLRRSDYRFQVTAFFAMDHIENELRLWGVVNAEVGSQVPISETTGAPLWSQANRPLHNPGVAVRFRPPGRTIITLALDTYAKMSANLRAIGLTIEAMRSIDRHGAGAILGQMMVGLHSLPAPPIALPAPDRQEA